MPIGGRPFSPNREFGERRSSALRPVEQRHRCGDRQLGIVAVQRLGEPVDGARRP